MGLEFATTDPARAKEFLDTEQMNYLTQETKDFILQGVKDGLCRVRDPLMYGGASGVVPEVSDRETWEPFEKRVKELHTRDFESRPQTVTFAAGEMPDGYSIEYGKELARDDGEKFWSWYGIDLRYGDKDARRAVRYVSQPIVTPTEQEHPDA